MEESVLIGEGVSTSKIHYELIAAHPDGIQVSIDETESVFKLFSLAELLQEISVDGMKVKTIQQLKGYATTLVDIYGEYTFDQFDNEFSLAELANCSAIGYENTKLLFTNNQNQLFIFYPDGGDVYKLNVNLNDVKSISIKTN